MTKKTLTALALVLATIPAVGFAQSAGQPMRPNPPVFDFAVADADGSGGISVEEWTAYAGGLRETARAEMVAARAEALLAAGDANGDGVLGQDELVTGMTALGEQRREARGERGGERFAMLRHHGEGHGMRGHDRGEGRWHERGEGRGEGRGEMRGEMRGEPGSMGFQRIDADNDGQISAEELAHAQEMVNWMASRPVRN